MQLLPLIFTLASASHLRHQATLAAGSSHGVSVTTSGTCPTAGIDAAGKAFGGNPSCAVKYNQQLEEQTLSGFDSFDNYYFNYPQLVYSTLDSASDTFWMPVDECLTICDLWIISLSIEGGIGLYEGAPVCQSYGPNLVNDQEQTIGGDSHSYTRPSGGTYRHCYECQILNAYTADQGDETEPFHYFSTAVKDNILNCLSSPFNCKAPDGQTTADAKVCTIPDDEAIYTGTPVDVVGHWENKGIVDGSITITAKVSNTSGHTTTTSAGFKTALSEGFSFSSTEGVDGDSATEQLSESVTDTFSSSLTEAFTATEEISKGVSVTVECKGRLYQFVSEAGIAVGSTPLEDPGTLSVSTTEYACVPDDLPFTTSAPKCPPNYCGDVSCQCCNEQWTADVVDSHLCSA